MRICGGGGKDYITENVKATMRVIQVFVSLFEC